MEKIFQYDNPVWNSLGKIFDLVYITLLWIAFCLPVLTIGAATTAAYSCARSLKEDEGQLTHVFMLSFRSNFRKSTIIWMIIFFAGTVLSADLYFFSQIEADWSRIMFFVTLIFIFILITMSIYMFSMISRFDGTLRQLSMMSFLLSIKSLPWSIFLVIVLLAVLSVVLLKYWFIGLIAAGLIVYIHTWVLEDIYRKHGLVN